VHMQLGGQVQCRLPVDPFAHTTVNHNMGGFSDGRPAMRSSSSASSPASTNRGEWGFKERDIYLRDEVGATVSYKILGTSQCQ
jgi:hypothetical protein